MFLVYITHEILIITYTFNSFCVRGSVMSNGSWRYESNYTIFVP